MMTAEGEPMSIKTPPPARGLAARSILVVDDDPVQRVLLVHAFWDVEATIFQAGDGAEALSLIESQRPDLVIMDARMPNMGGPQTLAALARLEQRPKLILTSGNTSDFGPVVQGLTNVVAVIDKPVGLEHLRRVVFEALDGA